jgi:serine/threonine protein kinase
MAPERITGAMEGTTEMKMAKADVWSVGILLFMMVFGRPPFEGAMISNLVKGIKKASIKLKDSGWHPDLKAFV